MSKVLKGLKRLGRILNGKKGIYGKYGRGNKFLSNVAIMEDSKVGSYNYFGPRTMLNNAVIGNYCSIAPDVKIGQGEHSLYFITTYQKLSKKIINHSLNKSPAIVGNDVWIGANVVIKQGVKISDGAVIGANAVVTKDIPPYAVAVGVPAKVIKYRFNKKKIDEILSSRWYEEDIKTAGEKIKYLNNKWE